MIRTGYLRWEIEVDDVRSQVDSHGARSFSWLAQRTGLSASSAPGMSRPPSNSSGATPRMIRSSEHSTAAEARSSWPSPTSGRNGFATRKPTGRRMVRYWMEKLQREASTFAHEVVRVASSFPQLVITSPALRAGYARLVETEIFRVIEGKSTPQPTSDEPITLDAAAYQQGVPELVAAELVRNVVEPKEFHEFCQFDCVTVKNGDKYYRIPRRPHGLIEVWDASTRRPHARLCVVFEDPGMPPSDEVVMKYLLAKHQPDLLWQVSIRFSPPTGKFEVTPPRRWTVD